MDLFEAINTTRAMRRLKTDPVPDDLIWKIIEAAIRAPSGGNRQPWGFIVVRDPETKKQVHQWYLEGWNDSYARIKDQAMANPVFAKSFKSAEHLAHNLADVPVFIFAVMQVGPDAGITAGASIYPAVQNLMLAARAYGLGTTITTLYRGHEEETQRLLSLPDGYQTMCLIPMGYPKGKFGMGPRRPVEEVTHWEKWGETKTR